MSKLKSFYKYICESLMQIKSHILCNDKIDYWDKLYDKYYERYKVLSVKELRRLQSIKSVNYNVNLSYPWTTIFISAILGAVVSNIIDIVKFLSSDIPVNLDQSYNSLGSCNSSYINSIIRIFLFIFKKNIFHQKKYILYATYSYYSIGSICSRGIVRILY